MYLLQVCIMKVEEGWTLWTCAWLLSIIKKLVPYFCFPPPTTNAWLKNWVIGFK